MTTGIFSIDAARNNVKARKQFDSTAANINAIINTLSQQGETEACISGLISGPDDTHFYHRLNELGQLICTAYEENGYLCCISDMQLVIDWA